MTENELRLMRKLTIGEEAVRLAGLEPNSDRTRYLAALHRKLASGHTTENERVAAAEVAMAQAREEARQTLLSGGHSGHAGPTTSAPVAGKKTFDLLASKAAQTAGAERVRAEAAQWRAQAAARERRRRQMVARAADADAGEIGARARGLRAAIRAAGGLG